jgi:putative hydrolase of the HAD superfamily
LLIIFDLDDTLIDTSGCITYYKLEDALRAMVSAGLVLPDFSEGLDLLRRLDRSAESARAALAEFAEIVSAGKEIFEIGVNEIYEQPLADMPIFPLEGVVEELLGLRHCHQLALVTIGKYAYQMEKLKKAGIDSHLFSKIVVTEERDKKPHYQLIMDELGYFPTEVIVCGDRVALDLIPAQELGFKTVHVRWGRGSTGFKYRGDHSILKISELREIVNSLSRESL